ncbi:helix-turn-helix domain-containing protein [Leifsonia sp. TF02-11]|uniref:helix-turn-helix domain-containing protein n=1 Tax=Leifsonia sp. TF02-11 TaxID=2815212 RepID=UPI001AA18D92|nr:helix-turn-helix domain-containing protein [Leifsonia sp. TF02-11]MBO1739680.1 helix-turn-helix domain-containing protein [Leifsonia sp. TF02-11]
MTAAGRTFDAERAQELFDQGLGCNAIARELGVAPSTVSKWAKDTKRVFDRTQTAAAVKAHTVDLAAGRIRLAEKMLNAAEAMIDAIDDPYLVYNFGGKDNTYNETLLDSAPVEVRRNIITTAGITFDKLSRIVENSGAGADDAKSMLAQLGRALGIGQETSE